MENVKEVFTEWNWKNLFSHKQFAEKEIQVVSKYIRKSPILLLLFKQLEVEIIYITFFLKVKTLKL